MGVSGNRSSQRKAGVARDGTNVHVAGGRNKRNLGGIGRERRMRRNGRSRIQSDDCQRLITRGWPQERKKRSKERDGDQTRDDE
jgi:hypothetical protein